MLAKDSGMQRFMGEHQISLRVPWAGVQEMAHQIA